MKAPKYVSSVTDLAQAIGLSRQWTSELFRLADHPQPSKSGHSVARWKKYITRRAEKVQSSGGEKARLEMELLRKRIQRVDLEIAELDNSRQEEIANRIAGGCLQVVDTLKSQLWRMPDELSGIFSVLAEPMAICTRFRAEMHHRFQVAYDELTKVKRASRRKGNLIPFNPVGANGSRALNGKGKLVSPAIRK